MFDHVSIGVRDIARSRAFYDAALEPLGFSRMSTADDSLGYGDDAVRLWVDLADSPVPADPKSGLHFCFVGAGSRERREVSRRRARRRRSRQRQAGTAPGLWRRLLSRPMSSTPTATGSKPCVSEPDRHGDHSDLAGHSRIRRRRVGGHSRYRGGAYAPGAGFRHRHEARAGRARRDLRQRHGHPRADRDHRRRGAPAGLDRRGRMDDPTTTHRCRFRREPMAARPSSGPPTSFRTRSNRNWRERSRRARGR